MLNAGQLQVNYMQTHNGKQNTKPFNALITLDLISLTRAAMHPHLAYL